MEIVLNGEPHTATGGATVLDLLTQLNIHPSRVAIERNGLIVRKDAWAGTALEPGDRLEIVHFVGGGC